MVRFDITNTLPVTSDYEYISGADVTELSYYNDYSPHITLDKYNVYINTWTTAPGSFPINQIWIDYGDGSEIDKIARNRPIACNYDTDHIAFKNIKQDPRNYIFNHSYDISDNELHTYTVTVTAFSLNTNTYSIGYRDISGVSPKY